MAPSSAGKFAVSTRACSLRGRAFRMQAVTMLPSQKRLSESSVVEFIERSRKIKLTQMCCREEEELGRKPY